MNADIEDRLRAALRNQADGTDSAVPDPAELRGKVSARRQISPAGGWMPSVAAAIVVAGLAVAITVTVNHRSAGRQALAGSAAQSPSLSDPTPSASPLATDKPTGGLSDVPQPTPQVAVSTGPLSIANLSGPLQHEIVPVNAWTIHCNGANYIVYAGQSVGIDAMARYYPTGIGSVLGVISYQPSDSHLKPFHYEGSAGLGPLKITALTCSAVSLVDTVDGSEHSYDLADQLLH
ncbi:MAG: hypothetical protein ABI418_00980 [Jatrophihabitantaceae bacterium]